MAIEDKKIDSRREKWQERNRIETDVKGRKPYMRKRATATKLLSETAKEQEMYWQSGNKLIKTGSKEGSSEKVE